MSLILESIAQESGAESAAHHAEEHSYNAQVTETIPIHESLRIVRIQPDIPVIREPGQYTFLGLKESARYLDFNGALATPVRLQPSGMLKRAYSFSSKIFDDCQSLVDPATETPLEFYIALVSETPDHAAGLTPRLFALEAGDRLLIGIHAKGAYTLAPVQPDDDVVFAATGTGEAPHNAMIASLLKRGHRGRIVAVTCARYLRDLAYVTVHHELERRFSNYRYVPLTTRERSNLDSTQNGYVGKRYLQDYLVSRQMSERLGRELYPGKLHVFVCGNPQMIGPAHRDSEGSFIWPTPRGVLQTLSDRGFRIAEHGQPGEVHYERYW